MVVWCDSPGSDVFAAVLQQRLQAAAAGPVVHPTIRANYERALAEVQGLPVTTFASAAANGAAAGVCPTLLSASASVVLRHARLRSEIYGPAVLAVRCRDAAEMTALVQSLHGHLTATMHGDAADFAAHGELCALLQQKVGRLVANGVPTGVDVCAAMVHGGPWPASSDARFSAVGPTSIRRWVRPLCWQDWPAALLPVELRDDNPRRLRRLVDGVPVSG
jgi:NADP-dependent aldehyde dehydrogenase